MTIEEATDYISVDYIIERLLDAPVSKIRKAFIAQLDDEFEKIIKMAKFIKQTEG